MVHSFDKFVEMGGYARYVWPAYGIALAVLMGNLWFGLKKRKSVLQRLQRARRLEMERQ